MGFVLNRGPGGNAEELNVADGAQSQLPGGRRLRTRRPEHRLPEDIYYTKPVESVVFSHQTHAVDLGFKCTGCHTRPLPDESSEF